MASWVQTSLKGLICFIFKSWNINNDKELIKKLFELFCLTLERLVELEIISECQAEVKHLSLTVTLKIFWRLVGQ